MAKYFLITSIGVIIVKYAQIELLEGRTVYREGSKLHVANKASTVVVVPPRETSVLVEQASH